MLVVEAIAIGVIIPTYLAGQDLNARVVYTASTLADRIAVTSLCSTQVTLPADFVMGKPSTLGPGQSAGLEKALPTSSRPRAWRATG